MELTDVFKEPVYTVLYSGAVNNVGDWKKNEHSHNFGEILFVKKGRRQIRINGEKRSVRYGDLVIYNPGDVHRESSYENEEFGILFVTLRPVGQAPARIVPDGMPQILPTGTSAVKVENFFTEIIDTLENKSAAMTDLPIYFAGFLLHMIGEIGRREDPTDNLEQRCAALKRILDRDFCRIRSLDDVRHNPYVSRYYFYKRFKELYGCSPLVYLRRKKLTYAAELLAGTDLRIIEIANTVGFDNEYYFSRLFAKETGMSASEYRRQKQGGDPAGKEPE